jgi:hypothetical protein
MVRGQPIARGDGARQRMLQAALQVLDQDGLPGAADRARAATALHPPTTST